MVMDVSGDDPANEGSDTAAARDAAAALGITINGLAMGDDDLVDWYSQNVKTADGFVLQAEEIDDFSAVVLEKLRREIRPGNPPVDPNPIPEPATATLIGVGLALTGFLRGKLRV